MSLPFGSPRYPEGQGEAFLENLAQLDLKEEEVSGRATFNQEGDEGTESSFGACCPPKPEEEDVPYGEEQILVQKFIRWCNFENLSHLFYFLCKIFSFDFSRKSNIQTKSEFSEFLDPVFYKNAGEISTKIPLLTM